jgi:hypothetical protein
MERNKEKEAEKSQTNSAKASTRKTSEFEFGVENEGYRANEIMVLNMEDLANVLHTLYSDSAMTNRNNVG